ncbi:MAG TPA: ABC transporter permease [Longimicrobiaceae bacterium]|nr:ABC transporter permease [Longimicrobiaceae bacterium]
MRFLNVLRDFVVELRRQKLRSTLTILGITWGTVAVVVLLAFGQGLGKQMKKNARGIGESVVILTPGTTAKSYQGFPLGRRISLEERDVSAIRAEVKGVKRISPEYGRWTPVHRGRQNASPWVAGVYPEYGDMRNVFAQAGGRFFNLQDMEQRRRVAFVGDKMKDLLFGEEDAVGQTVFIGATPFTVIGVLQPKTQNSSYQSRDQDRIFIPSTTYRSVFGENRPARILYQPADRLHGAEVKEQVMELLGRRHRFDPTDADAVYVWDTAENLKFFDYLFLGFNVFLGVVGSFTLIVGGVGVANIMYIVVRERTREIGIKRALGARRRDILVQVFAETALVVGFGALLGVILSAAMVAAGAALPMQDQIGTPVLSARVVGVTLALLVVVAFFAGLFPARRAANLDPVECLRYGV